MLLKGALRSNALHLNYYPDGRVQSLAPSGGGVWFLLPRIGAETQVTRH